MKSMLLLLSILLTVPQVQAKDYSQLPRERRVLIEKELMEFLPKLNSAALAVLQELFSKASRPLAPDEDLNELKLASGDTYSKILERQGKEAPMGVSFLERSGLILSELLSVTNGGLELMALLKGQSSYGAYDFERALNAQLSVDEDEDERTVLVVNSLGFPYCNVEILVENVKVNIQENCD